MYKVFGSPVLTIIKNSENRIELNAMSSKESAIKKLTLSIKDISFTKDFSHDEKTNRYSIDISSEESSTLKAGSYYYDLDVFYEDESSEVESYSAKIVIQ